MAKLKITGLSIKTKIGIHAWEQKIDQTVRLDIEFPLDLSNEIQEIGQTIDYATVCETITAFIETNRFELLEQLAQRVGNLLLEQFKPASINLTASKPNAIANAENISIDLRINND